MENINLIDILKNMTDEQLNELENLTYQLIKSKKPNTKNKKKVNKKENKNNKKENKVISFCVWGQTKLYHYGLWENAMLLPKIYPGWKMVIYYTPTALQSIIDELDKLPYVETILIDAKDGSQNAMLRFLASFDSKYDVVISRDADSRLLQREADAVKEWLDSDKDFHIMRDHPANRSLIMAGMWGARNKILQKPEIIKKFWEYFKDPEFKKWSNDQKYLSKYIYPLVKNNSMVHSSFFKPESWAKPFPKNTVTRKRGFVGMTVHSIPESRKYFKLSNDVKVYKVRKI